jgi:hypothetical protein
MWILIVWALTSTGDLQPQQALVSLSEKDCRQMETFVNKKFSENKTFIAECVKSLYY